MSSRVDHLGLQGSEAAQVGDDPACHTDASTRVEVLQCGKAAQVGDGPGCHTVAPTKV
jgi:hypothetical protein